jgi:hypothetical protein
MGQYHATAALYPRESPGTHCAGSCVGPRAGLDERKISSPPGFFFFNFMFIYLCRILHYIHHLHFIPLTMLFLRHPPCSLILSPTFAC